MADAAPNTMQSMPKSWQRRLRRKAALALSESRQIWSTRYGATAALHDQRRRSGHYHWNSRARVSRKRLKILEKSLRRRRALASLFVCARCHFDFVGQAVLIRNQLCWMKLHGSIIFAEMSMLFDPVGYKKRGC